MLNNIGERLREERLDRGMSAEDLAIKCGISSDYIKLIERGGASPTVSSMQMMLSALDLSMSEFFEEPPVEQVVFHRSDMPQNGDILTVDLAMGDKSPFILRIAPREQTAIRSDDDVLFYVLSGGVTVKTQNSLSKAFSGDTIRIKPSMRYYFIGYGRTTNELLGIPISKGEFQ